MHEALETWKPSPSDPWDFAAASHLWRRAAFSAPPAVVEATLELEPSDAVSRIVGGPERDIAAEELETIYDTLLGMGNVDRLRGWLIARALRCGHQLREKTALFWHGHFATSIAKVRDPVWMMRQYRKFLSRGLGSFPVLLGEIARDPAMLRWLDNETNRKGHPNENFARELFELFTLGVGNYGERDIQEAARAFTGWQILNDRFHLSESLHDKGEKRVLGHTGHLGGEDVLAIALDQAACSEFLAAKLLRFFAHPEPPDAVIAALGTYLREHDYDIGATLKLLFGSHFFFDASTRNSLIKSPMEFAVGSARALDVELDPASLVPQLREMGQDLLAPPNVKGWPGQRAWINTATWLTRINAADDLARRVPAETEGAEAIERYGRALLGGQLDRESKRIIERSRGKDEIVRALLSLPEAHLS